MKLFISPYISEVSVSFKVCKIGIFQIIEGDTNNSNWLLFFSRQAFHQGFKGRKKYFMVLKEETSSPEKLARSLVKIK